jgi:Tol biopolymer transport system component
MKERLILYILPIISILLLFGCEQENENNKGLKNIYVDNTLFLYKGEYPCSPCWFPDGENIAFIEQNPFNKNGIESWISVIDKNGSNYHTLNKYKEFYAIYDLDVSPDGEWIVFEGKENSDDGLNDMYLIPTGGGDAIRLYIGGNEYSPHFSNDGQWIYFIGTLYGDGVYKVRRDGTELVQTAAKEEGLHDIDLTPDNNYIVYSSLTGTSPDNTNRICVYSISEDRSWTVFEKKSVYVRNISVSPDGRWICFDDYGLNIIPLKDGEPISITSNSDYYPNWSNDGKWIVFIRDGQKLYKLLVPNEFLPE